MHGTLIRNRRVKEHAEADEVVHKGLGLHHLIPISRSQFNRFDDKTAE